MVKKAKDSIAEIQEQAKEPIDKEAILQDAIVSQIIKQLAPEQEPQESQIPQVIHNVDFRPIIKLNGNFHFDGKYSYGKTSYYRWWCCRLKLS